MSNEPAKLAEESEDKPQEKSGADIIQKVKDEVNKLPTLWIDQPTIKSLLKELFGIDGFKYRFKTYGAKSLLDTLLPPQARDYIYASSTLLSLLAPDTVFTKVSGTIRNIALLDSLVDVITCKIERSSCLERYQTLTNILKDIKDCPIKLHDYYIDYESNVSMGGMFVVSMSQYAVGSRIELTSSMFNRTGDESETIHCKVMYRTAVIEDDKYGYFIRSTSSYCVVIAEVEEYHMYILMYISTTSDRHDLTIRRIYPGSMKIYGLYTKSSSSDFRRYSMSWCEALPFSMVDFSKFVCQIANGGVGVLPRSTIERRTDNEIFDINTDKLVKRILHAEQMGCSRSYALVGIPGTGKSFIMNKIVKDSKHAAVIIPCLPEQGMSWEYRNYLQTVITAISKQHIYILLDDFDKYMSDDENNGKTNQELIFFFDFLHDNCPGGVDPHGKVKKTFTLIATMNNPKILANAIIKRSERFDEVIEIGLPQPFIYGKRLNMIKDKGDATDFESRKFRLLYWYMRQKVITLADIGNIYAIMKTHRNKECNNCTYGIKDLFYAIRFIGKNRKSASKEYAI